MHWTVQHVVTDDYTMFVHLLNRTDQAVAGVNAYHLSMHTAPMNGSRAKRSSQALCLISRPGAYSFELGMYSAFDFERISTVDAANLIFGNRILLGW